MNRVRSSLLIFLFLLVSVSLAHAADTSGIQDQIDAINEQKASLDAEIAKYQKQLNALGAQRQTLQSTIQTLTLTQSQLTAKISSTQKSISAANLQLDQLGSQIGSTEDSIDVEKRAVMNALRNVQAIDDFSVPEQVFSASSLGEAWTAIDSDQQLALALQGHTRNLSVAKDALTTRQSAVNEKKKQLSSLHTDLSTQNKQLTANKQAQQTLLSQTKNQESAFQALIASKRAEEAAFEAQLFNLSTQLKAANTTGLPSKGTYVFAWPLSNILITQPFGKTSVSGRLYTSGTHDGVDFAAPLGTPIKAALTGTVFATNEGAVQNCQYGKWVIVKHANGLATLYAHLSSIEVKKGQAVTTGTELGLSGMTGYATGPHLHMTVYVADAVTLKQYTCKSGYTVTIPIAPTNAYLDPMSYMGS